jgi:hypothetical protein
MTVTTTELSTTMVEKVECLERKDSKKDFGTCDLDWKLVPNCHVIDDNINNDNFVLLLHSGASAKL